MQEYHQTVLKNIEIDAKVIPPPPTVSLNENNINLAQKAILAEYQTSDGAENFYAALRYCNGKFYSLMKCTMEYKNLQESWMAPMCIHYSHQMK